MMFKKCGFIPVDMEGNASGVSNNYDAKTFRAVLKGVKKATEDGFDVGVLPEGQLNPRFQEGLLECYQGAWKMAKLTRGEVEIIGIKGTGRIWHADKGVVGEGRIVEVRRWGKGIQDPEEGAEEFKRIVGEYGKG
ncbi:hypothetical protein TrCOL_g3058 [Triparma columacea]|uniref:Uncharacterized protein n=1 Tax=Triparma columacea TaxID=722753 RepID=A0A9W7LF59_9STRA|nr:hypothetical protein TrCOL_g3058 [Triparma columacea]